MDGPVLSGGVIVLVAVLLWMLYLLPSWRGRFQYNAAERNAVRLNQALRVLAETSETPQEVRFELNARTALAQQKLAKRVQSEREAAELESLREQLAATRADPVIRRARARRRVRMVSTVSLLLGLAAVGFGIWQLVVAGSSLLLWLGGALIVPAGIALQRMAAVAARAARATHVVSTPVVERVAASELHDQGRATWTPRPLPEPLVSVAGSRAQAAQDQIEAQEERRKAARVAALRERAEQ
ncbi:MAG: hypothetical protein CVT61_17055, partial [Actinobacteria bacterium HGW-Actinobacteria-11]